MTTHGDLPPDIISNSTSSRRTDHIGVNAINGVNEINGSDRLNPSVQGVENPSVKVEPADPQSAGDIDVKPSSSVLDSIGPNAEWEAQLGGKKRKWAALGFNPSQMDELEGVALSHHIALMQDQADVLYPAPPTAFSSYTDAVERLLPYHIYQIHDSELEGQEKNVAAEARRERRDARDATELDKRIRKVQERYFALRRREGTHPSPLPPLISLIQSSTHALRQEIAVVQAQYRTAKAHHDAAENVRREKERQEQLTRNFANSQRESQEAAARAKAAQTLSSSINPPPKPAPPVVVRPPAQAPHTPQPVQTPVRPSTPATPITFTTPHTPSSAPGDNSELLPRPRGRPKGRGRGGLRETTLTHVAAAQAARPVPLAPARPPSTPSAPSTPVSARPSPSTTNTPSTPSAPPDTSASSSVSAAATPATSQQAPVSITIPLKAVQSFVQMGLLTIPHDERKKTPGTVLRTTADRKNVVVSIALGMCSQQQLQGLAKVLGVTSKPGEGPATPTAPIAGGSAKPAAT